MTARTYWRVALPLSLVQILLAISFISDTGIRPLLFWAWIIPQGADLLVVPPNKPS